MLPSLSKHFIKALLAPIIRGPNPSEVAAYKKDKDKTQWKIELTTYFKRRPDIHKTMDRPMHATTHATIPTVSN